MDTTAIAALAGGALLLWYVLKPTPAKAEPKTEPKQPKEQTPAEPPRVPNDGEHPKTTPTQGSWYQTKEGDILIKIMRAAGLPDRANLYCTDHPENAWIARYKQQNGTMTLKLWPRYRPPYKGEYLDRSTGNYPVIYIPTLDEYKKSRWYK